MRWTVAATLLLAALSGISADWYVSNSVGIRGEEIGPEQAAEHEYVLRIEDENGIETRLLLHDGETIQRVELVRQGSTTLERTYREGELESEVVTRDDGKPLREKLYVAGELTEQRDYSYNNDRLVSRAVRDESGELLYTETYSYWRDGSLRSLVKEEQSAVRTEYRYADGRLQEEWISAPGSSERFRFDPAGRLVVRERFVDGELEEQEVRRYWGASADALIREVVISEGQTEIRRGYDERGRLTSERVQEGEELRRELVRIFDGDRLASEVEETPEGTRRWEYEYGEESEPVRIAYLEDGVLVEVEHRLLEPSEAPADRMVELYRRGEPILRVYYAGQQRIREEVIRDGEVIQRREFTRPEGDGEE